MTAQVAQNFPFPKFSMSGFGFSSKSRTSKMEENDDDWYIPYNGPYEAPPDRRKARDSWGDPLEPDDEKDTLFNDKELNLRYGGRNDPSYVDGDRHLEGELMGRKRDRTFSVTSGQTVSSGTMDHSRPTYRRSTVSAGTRHVQPSYISMDAVGSVGESPVPPRRSSQERNRTTLAGIFSFNAHSRKPSTHTAASTERTLTGSSVRKPSLLQRSNVHTDYDNERVSSNIDPPARYSSSTEHANSFVKDKHQQLRHQVMLYAGSVASDTDYHNSHYSTLVHEQRSDINHHRHRLSPSLSEDLHHSRQPPFDQSSLDRQKSKPDHHFARTIPRNNVEILSKAPPLPPKSPRRPTTSPHNTKPHISSYTPLYIQKSLKLRNSTSTPNLRYSAVDAVVTPGIQNADLIPQPIATPRFVVPKAKDRWLSAETWCDALLFPRPRLKSGNVPTNVGSSGRIVSPPGSPGLIGSMGTREPGIASRVLAHSRSLMDLNTPVDLSSNYSYPHASTSAAHERDPRAGLQSTNFAQDDLALASPVPSLRHVLVQGEQLANERMAWQLQAQMSFGNKHSRTLVRAHSKSLANGRRRGHQAQSSIEYLAAQACLGNQNLHPSLSTSDLHTTTSSFSRKTSSKKSSLAPTRSKSSKSHSRNHSKDSWSKPAVKVAMSTAAICGFSALQDEVTVLDPGDARAASLEGALKRDGTRVIRLADPVHLPVDRGLPINESPKSSIRLSSSHSNSSDRRVGIALGTPPLGDDHSDSFHPSHPYAQGGLSFSPGPGPSSQTRKDRGVEFAGPHPSINSGVDISQIPDSLARHKLPPHLYLHPYGNQGLARDSYLDQNGLLAQYRSGDETPHQNKMWAQLSPGVLREILPNDIQYSPHTPQVNNVSPVSVTSRDSIMQINDTIGVGVTLVNAERRSQASRPGSNDSDANVIPISQVDGVKQSQNEPRTIRQPIESNLALSEDLDALPKPSLTNQIVSSTLKQHLPLTPISLSDRAFSTSPTITSTSSSPPLTPHRLGSPNDLESFQDLFYRPNNDIRRTPIEAALPDTPSPPHFSSASWDRSVQRHKAESGLTNLTRQLGQEFGLMNRERERLNQHSPVRSTRLPPSGGVSSQPTLEFVFEEDSHSEPVPEIDCHAIQAFQPSDSLPEDIESSRASSVIETADAEDETAMLRVGVVESILTPVTVSPQNRPHSYSGETSSATNHNEHRQQDQPSSSRATGVVSGDVARARTFSGLNPLVSEATRISYMTTSTVSRMSDLSDFPVPPKDHRVSLGTYFNEPLPPAPPLTEEQQHLFFGRNQDAGDLAKTLSSN